MRETCFLSLIFPLKLPCFDVGSLWHATRKSAFNEVKSKSSNSYDLHVSNHSALKCDIDCQFD